MADLDPEKFDQKYVHYFNELQRAYKSAFEHMNERYDSQLIHAIDQQVLNESEPFYEEGSFRVELPNEPYSRIRGVVVDRDRFESVLEAYVDRIEIELGRIFGVDSEQ